MFQAGQFGGQSAPNHAAAQYADSHELLLSKPSRDGLREMSKIVGMSRRYDIPVDNDRLVADPDAASGLNGRPHDQLGVLLLQVKACHPASSADSGGSNEQRAAADRSDHLAGLVHRANE